MVCGLSSGVCALHAAGCGLQAAGCGLRAASCGLRAASCGLRAAGCRLRAAGCRLLCVLRTTLCSWSFAVSSFFGPFVCDPLNRGRTNPFGRRKPTVNHPRVAGRWTHGCPDASQRLSKRTVVRRRLPSESGPGLLLTVPCGRTDAHSPSYRLGFRSMPRRCAAESGGGWRREEGIADELPNISRRARRRGAARRSSSRAAPRRGWNHRDFSAHPRLVPSLASHVFRSYRPLRWVCSTQPELLRRA